MNPTRESVQTTLSELVKLSAGHEAVPHPEQLQAVELVLCDGKNVILKQPTSWGKTLPLLAAARCVHAAGDGITVVACPTISLMDNHVRAARAAGIQSATLNSSNQDSWRQTLARIYTGEVEVLYVMPEFLASDSRMHNLRDYVGLVGIDEVHKLAGYKGFRDDFQRFPEILARLGNPPVMAASATITPHELDEITRQLGPNTVVLAGEVLPENLYLVRVAIKPTKRMQWLDAVARNLQGSGLIYTFRVSEAEAYSQYLEQAGHSIATYHSHLGPAQRRVCLQNWSDGDSRILAATEALSMGIDNAAVRWVAQMGIAQSPTDFAQRIGRAGRDGSHAFGILVPLRVHDESLADYVPTQNLPDPCAMQITWRAVRDESLTMAEITDRAGQPLSVVRQTLKQLAVDRVVIETKGSWCRVA